MKKLSKNKFLQLASGLLLLGILSWFMVGQYQKMQTVTFTIPPGTAQQLAAGNQVITLPNELTFSVGDTIVINNQDDAVHTFGPFTILPNTTLTKQFRTVKTYQSSCTFHKDQQMMLVVQPAWWHIF